MKKLQSIFTRYNFCLILILAGGLFLRIYQISLNPPALNWDEASHGYNAYSIMRTGRDEWGMDFPLIFRAFGDYKLPAYIYLSILPIRIFGLNLIGVRFVSILSGLGLIGVSYFLGLHLTKDKLGGIIAAFLTAIMPWSLFISRVAVEANLAAFFFSLGWLLFFKKKYIGTAAFWGLSLYSYNSARVLVPLLAVLLVVKLLSKREIKQSILTAVIFFLFLLPVVSQFFGQEGTARFYWVNIVDQGVVNQINQRRGESNLPDLAAKLLFNRPTYFVTISAENYLNHFSPQWLFLEGGDHYQFSFPGHGLIYLVSGPFLIIGLIKLIINKKWWWLLWFLGGFLPSAITKDSPHVLRSILILPLPMVFSAAGVIETKNWIKDKSRIKGLGIVIVFIGINLVSFGIWWHQYWTIYRENYSWSWQYGYQEAVDFVKNNYSKYDQIIFTKRYGEPHIFVLFHWPWEPEFYQTDPTKEWDYHTNWYWVDRFDKFRFWNDWEVIENIQELENSSNNVLLVTSPGNYIEEGEVVKTIEFLHGNTAFEIVSYRWADQ